MHQRYSQDRTGHDRTDCIGRTVLQTIAQKSTAYKNYFVFVVYDARTSSDCLTISETHFDFWATVCKTFRPMLSDRYPDCPLCNVGVLWPNAWMDQNETWHAGRPRPWSHTIRWRPSSPSRRVTQATTFGPYLFWPNG